MATQWLMELGGYVTTRWKTVVGLVVQGINLIYKEVPGRVGLVKVGVQVFSAFLTPLTAVSEHYLVIRHIPVDKLER